MAEPKKYDDDKPWWQNSGCLMRFQLDSSQGSITGTLDRIDVNEYRKYAVVNNGVRSSINIDHIVYVRKA